MRKVKWGVIGLGNIANKFAEAILGMDNVELEAVASRSKEKAEVFGKKHNINLEKCYGSYKELLNDENVEAVYIAVPHVFHKELSILALNHGKAVLCEKPVTISADEIKEVIKVAGEKKIFFMEAMKTRFLPINQKIKSLIDEGKIGEVRLLQADFGFNAPFNATDRLFDKSLGGGALLDVGIYNVAYSTFIFGSNPKSIDSTIYEGKSNVDESISVTLGYEGGKQAQLYSAINLNTIRTANIIGTKGIISVLRFSNADTAFIKVNGEEEKIHMPFKVNGFEYQIEEVVRCINEGKIQSEMMSWNDSIEIMEIMDKIKNKGKRI